MRIQGMGGMLGACAVALLFAGSCGDDDTTEGPVTTSSGGTTSGGGSGGSAGSATGGSGGTAAAGGAGGTAAAGGTGAAGGAGGSTSGAVDCDGETCTANEVCCVQGNNVQCQDANGCNSGIQVFCDGPEDCPGGSCCNQQVSLDCLANCGDGNGQIVCTDAGDCTQNEPECCAVMGGFVSVCMASCT